MAYEGPTDGAEPETAGSAATEDAASEVTDAQLQLESSLIFLLFIILAGQFSGS